MFKEMNKNGLKSPMLMDSTINMCIGSTISFIFKRCSKLQMDQSCKGTIKCDKPLGYNLKIFKWGMSF